MEMARDEVRVMTVHGAKGLEAPIVILADTTTPPAGPSHPPRLLPLPAERRAGRAGAPGLGAAQKATTSARWPRRAQAALGEARDEYRRLLYVAMTRAADRLIVCGVDGENKRPEGCWYDLVGRRARQRHVRRRSRPTTATGDVLRYRKMPDAAAAGSAAAAARGGASRCPAG